MTLRYNLGLSCDIKVHLGLSCDIIKVPFGDCLVTSSKYDLGLSCDIKVLFEMVLTVAVTGSSLVIMAAMAFYSHEKIDSGYLVIGDGWADRLCYKTSFKIVQCCLLTCLLQFL